MGEVFLKIVNMSIAASWLLAAVIFLRFLLKKAPKWMPCVLWGLAALRLVCPVTLESALSLVPSEETYPVETIYSENAAIADNPYNWKLETGIPALDGAGNNTLLQDVSTGPVLRSNLDILGGLWLAGTAGLILYAAVSYARLAKRVRACVPFGDRVWICDDIETPFILGVLRPKIYLPSGTGEAERAHVIAHERAHIKCLDHVWKPLGYLVLTVHWFNPLVWVAYVLFCRDIELACDERVVKDMGSGEKAAYSQALLDCSLPRRKLAVSPLAFGEVGVKERVKSVLSYKKPALWVVITALALCAVCAACFMTSPVKGDSLRFVKMESALFQRADFEVKLGKEATCAELRVELWSGGECTSGGSIVIGEETKMLTLLFSERENGLPAGVNVQIDTDEGAAVLCKFFPLVREGDGSAFTTWGNGEDLPVSAGGEVILAAMNCDYKVGGILYDCKKYAEMPELLENAECLIVIRAKFLADRADAGQYGDEASAEVDAHALRADGELLLSLIAEEKDAVKKRLADAGITAVDSAVSGAEITSGKLTLCGRDFDVRLKFDGNGIFYGFDCLSEAADLDADGIYKLCADISEKLSVDYGASKTYPSESNISNWASCADVPESGRAFDRWLVAEGQSYPGYEGSDFIMQAELSYFAETAEPYIAVSYDLIAHRASSFEAETGIVL